jgi:glycosyltransferase involved in cell wall biosynthesis
MIAAKGVSVIVCCHNSISLLKETIKHLSSQKVSPEVDWEIVVVDNASTDGTAAFALAEWQKYETDTPFLVVEEPVPGLSNARKRGISQARYEYLVFCDDDNWLAEDYVDNVFRLFGHDPKIAILGGTGTAEFEDKTCKPVWFDDYYHSYAVSPGAEQDAFMDTVYGAGMAVRKSVLQRVIDENPLFLSGRNKNKLSAGDDSELCLRVRLLGYTILRSAQLTFKHFLTCKRLTWDYLKKLHTGFAHTFVTINLYERAIKYPGKNISGFYWLKMGLYYLGITIKYYPKHLRMKKSGEGNIGELHHITWKTIATDFFKINFGLKTLHKKILSLGYQTHEL